MLKTVIIGLFNLNYPRLGGIFILFRPDNDFTIKEVKQIIVPISKRRHGNNGNAFQRVGNGFKDADNEDDEEDEFKILEHKLLRYNIRLNIIRCSKVINHKYMNL